MNKTVSNINISGTFTPSILKTQKWKDQFVHRGKHLFIHKIKLQLKHTLYYCIVLVKPFLYTERTWFTCDIVVLFALSFLLGCDLIVPDLLSIYNETKAI